ncbi:hypothetical protein DFH08DRAFT_801584 [Mycena albidolilacea]|uniref:Ricin B lectin domain-containing protein n=1 Tax=Mycena albidolilacea TaxID=1033008 RepID=A0AAD7F144_9AGAR|nr:hypothetical protein DFH08DRAFT_801584 [Mycena albidolilacea]
MFSKIIALAVSAAAFVSAVPSMQAPMVSCGVTMQASSVGHELGAGAYTIYNKARPSQCLVSYNPGAPVLMVPCDGVPAAFRTWKVTSLEEPGKFYITNRGTNSGGDLNVGLEFFEIDDVVVVNKGFGTPLSVVRVADGHAIGVHFPGLQKQVWEVCEEDEGLSRVHIDPFKVDGKSEQIWYFGPAYDDARTHH